MARLQKKAQKPTGKGATLMEYGFVVGFVALASVGAVFSTGTTVKEILCAASNGVRSGVTQVGVEMASLPYCALEVAQAPAEGAPVDPDAGDGEGVPDAPVEDGSGPDAGQGEGVEASGPEAAAPTPIALVGSFTDYTYKPGIQSSFSQMRQANIVPGDSYVFTAATVGDEHIPGALMACLNSACGSPVSLGESSASLDSVTRFGARFRFTPNAPVLEAFSFPVVLTLTSKTDASKSWSQTVTVSRPASNVGIVSLGVSDITLDPGAYSTVVDRTPFVLEGPISARWKAMLTELASEGDESDVNGTLLGGARWTNVGSVEREFTTDRATTIYRYLGQMLESERYNPLSRSFELTVQSLDEPDVVATETFVVSRPMKALDAPEMNISNIAVPAGKFGNIDFDALISGDGGKIFSIEQVVTDSVAPVLPMKVLYLRGSRYNLNGPFNTPLNMVEAVSTVRLQAALPSGSTLTEDHVWSFKALVSSDSDPNKKSVAEFTITRPAATFSADLNLSDLTLPVQAPRFTRYKSEQPLDGPQGFSIAVKNVQTSTSSLINAGLDVRACLDGTCTGYLDLSRISSSSNSKSSPVNAVSLEAYISDNLDVYEEIDIEFDVVLSLIGDSNSSIEQRIRVYKPAGAMFIPEITIAPVTVAQKSGPISFPFIYRANDSINVSFKGASTSAEAYISFNPNTTVTASNQKEGSTPVNAYNDTPVTKEGTITIATPGNAQAVDREFAMVVRPYGAGRSYTSVPAIEIPFRVQRADLQRAEFANLPGHLTLPAFGSVMNGPLMDLLNIPDGGDVTVYIDPRGLKNARFSLCGSNNVCDGGFGTGVRTSPVNLYNKSGSFYFQAQRTHATNAPSGSFILQVYHTGTGHAIYGREYVVTVGP